MSDHYVLATHDKQNPTMTEETTSLIIAGQEVKYTVSAPAAFGDINTKNTCRPFKLFDKKWNQDAGTLSQRFVGLLDKWITLQGQQNTFLTNVKYRDSSSGNNYVVDKNPCPYVEFEYPSPVHLGQVVFYTSRNRYEIEDFLEIDANGTAGNVVVCGTDTSNLEANDKTEWYLIEMDGWGSEDYGSEQNAFHWEYEGVKTNTKVKQGQPLNWPGKGLAQFENGFDPVTNAQKAYVTAASALNSSADSTSQTFRRYRILFTQTVSGKKVSSTEAGINYYKSNTSSGTFALNEIILYTNTIYQAPSIGGGLLGGSAPPVTMTTTGTGTVKNEGSSLFFAVVLILLVVVSVVLAFLLKK